MGCWGSAHQGGGVDHEAVADVRGENPIPRIVNLVSGHHFNLRGNALFRAVVQHFLGLRDTTNHGTSERAAATNKVPSAHRQRFRRCAHVHKGAVDRQQAVNVWCFLVMTSVMVKW